MMSTFRIGDFLHNYERRDGPHERFTFRSGGLIEIAQINYFGNFRY